MAKTVKEDFLGNGLSISVKETVPPARYTEATLVKKLEATNTGRPSTYATIVSTVLSESRNYAKKDGKYLVPTDKGMELAAFIDRALSNLINLDYTREMEEALDKIATGKETRPEFLLNFYNTMENTIKNNPELKQSESLDRVCPKCGSPLVVRRNKYGNKFIGCSSFPKCKYLESYKN